MHSLLFVTVDRKPADLGWQVVYYVYIIYVNVMATGLEEFGGLLFYSQSFYNCFKQKYSQSGHSYHNE